MDEVMVAIVRHTSECDVEAVLPPMTYGAAVEWLRFTLTTTPRAFDQLDLDLVYVDEDGSLGRYASWSVTR